MSRVKKVKWSKEEEDILITKIKENPNNLQEAFRQAAVLLDRSLRSVTQHWYHNSNKTPALKERCGKCFITYGGQSLNINRKVVSINTSDNTITITMEKLQQILDLLLN